MFTLLPSLYLVAVHYIRKWHTPYYYEENRFEEEKTDEKILLENNDQSLTNDSPPSSCSNSVDKNGYLPHQSNDEDDPCEVKVPPNKSNRSSSLLNADRRKPYTGDLREDDIIYLMNETGFTREQILLWYSDFLVCHSILWKYQTRLIDLFSAIVPMGNFRKRNLSIFTNNSTRKVRWPSFASTPFVSSIKTVLVI